MISKRTHIQAKNDNYARLASYIADAKNKGEKCLASWCEGCFGGENYKEGIEEVKDTQALNTRSKNAKTYHLIVSFRPEDEERFTVQDFKDIEKKFAEALGWSEHQRHCGIHKNTDNIHMHVSYNMVNPEKYTVHKEFRDFWIRDKVCRQLEQEYGLSIDTGRVATKDKERRNEIAATVEAQTGQQSFESYALEQKAAILESVAKAQTWQEVHKALAVYGMEIKPHGRGLVVKDKHSDRASHAMKASALDRSLSMKRLEDAFGQYEAPKVLMQVQEQSRYTAEPLHRAPERGQLFAEYQQGIQTRKTTLQAIKEREEARLAAIQVKWAEERRKVEKDRHLDARQRRNLVKTIRRYEGEDLAKAKLEILEARTALKQEVPFTSWNQFLQQKSEQGNEVALAVLRSRNEIAKEEGQEAPKKDWSVHGLSEREAEAVRLQRTKIQADYSRKESSLMALKGIKDKTKNSLSAINKMEKLAEEERLKRQSEQSKASLANPIAPPIIDGFKSHIDRKGTVIFTLPSGGIIRDTGKELRFSLHDKAAQTAALEYAKAKWGKNIVLDGNKVALGVRREWGWDKEKKRGVER